MSLSDYKNIHEVLLFEITEFYLKFIGKIQTARD